MKKDSDDIGLFVEARQFNRAWSLAMMDRLIALRKCRQGNTGWRIGLVSGIAGALAPHAAKWLHLIG